MRAVPPLARRAFRPGTLALLALGFAAACREDPGNTGDTTSGTTTTTDGTGGDGGEPTGSTTTDGGGGAGGDPTGGGGTGGEPTGGGGDGGGPTGGGGTGGTTTTTSTGGTGGGGGIPVGGSCSPDSGPPEITKVGSPGKLLLKGCIVTPEESFDGEVLVESDTLTCVGTDCSAAPGAATASVVVTHGIVLPGLIDAHNHILFDIFDETHWSPQQAYGNHNQWTNEARYKAMVDAKQYMNGEGIPTPGFGCEMNKYGELKGILAGTTSIVGAANPANKTCYGSLARTVDQLPNDLGADKIQVSTLFPPSASSANGVCNNIANGTTDAYVIHCGEGVDNTAKNEFNTLGTVTDPDFCLYVKQTTIIHGNSFGDAELTVMADNGMNLVWSPKSNVFLYGGGTDLTKTTNIPLAREKGITIAMGPDWSLGGSQNMLDELRFADMVDNTIWGDILSAKELVTMATVNGAKVLGLEAVLGSLEVGKKADLFVIGGDTEYPWDAVLAATPGDVRLVLVGGVPLFGDDALGLVAPASPGCETLSACGVQKFVCVAEPGGNATNKFGQTLAEITNILNTELVAYDDLNLSQWKFAPIAPLVKCP